MKFVNKKNINHNYGFTLIETMLTIFIFSIIMVGTTSMIRNIFTTSEQQFGILSNVDQARRIASTFVNELRNSTYGANGAYPLAEAANNEIIFFSTAIKNDGTVSRVRYYTTGNTLYKGITNPTGSPPVYVLNNETISTLNTNLSIGSNPIFYYYDGNYTGTQNSLTQPVNLNNVKFIQINLVVKKQFTPTSTSTFTVSDGAAIRNLKTNLGN